MTTLLDGRIDASRRTGMLAAGDAAMIALFVVLGELRHGGTAAAGAVTFIEFAAGWAVAAVAVGAYGDDAVDTPRRAAGYALAAWVPGALLGQAARVLVEPAANPAPAFVVVSLVVGGALLGTWRSVVAIGIDR